MNPTWKHEEASHLTKLSSAVRIYHTHTLPLALLFWNAFVILFYGTMPECDYASHPVIVSHYLCGMIKPYVIQSSLSG